LGLCAAAAAVAAATPTRHILSQSLGYTLWWASPAGMFAWLVLGWSVATLAPRPRRIEAGRAAPWALGAGLAAALAAGTAAAAAQARDQDEVEYGPIHTVIARVEAELPPTAKSVRIAGSSSFTAFDFKGALIYALRRDGRQPLILRGTRRLGTSYEARGRSAGATVSVWDGPVPRKAGPAIARIPLKSAKTGAIAVTLKSG
jgi:hypothetical protein